MKNILILTLISLFIVPQTHALPNRSDDPCRCDSPLQWSGDYGVDKEGDIAVCHGVIKCGDTICATVICRPIPVPISMNPITYKLICPTPEQCLKDPYWGFESSGEQLKPQEPAKY